MGQRQPFILDTDYRDKLDSDAWRQHFCRLNGQDAGSTAANTITITVFLVAFAAAGPVLLCFAYLNDSGVLYGLGSFAAAFGLIAAVASYFVVRSMRAEGEAFRQMAGQFVLVEGELTDCKTEVRHGEDGDEFFMVTASYRAVAPGGRELSGWKRHERNDLRDARLPAAGTPVLVMTLPDGSNAAMI
jgi:hypothetical protein